jgi:hypothetical protein
MTDKTLHNFSAELVSRSPSNWRMSFEILKSEHTGRAKVGFQRDDLYRWMITTPHNESWPPERVFGHFPNEVDKISDRPGVREVEVSPVSVQNVLDVLMSHSVEYQGEFDGSN